MTPAERLQELEGYQVPSLRDLREDFAAFRAHVDAIENALRDPFAPGAGDVLDKRSLCIDTCSTEHGRKLETFFSDLRTLGTLLGAGLLKPTTKRTKGKGA
jgi:hypothetical protein